MNLAVQYLEQAWEKLSKRLLMTNAIFPHLLRKYSVGFFFQAIKMSNIVNSPFLKSTLMGFGLFDMKISRTDEYFNLGTYK